MLNKLSLGNKNNKKSKKRVGRGIGSGLGKTCGLGHKGQKARSGVSIRWFEGGQMSLVKRLPKRGFKSFTKKSVDCIINLSDVELCVSNGLLKSGDVVDNKFLFSKYIINKQEARVKVLSKGELSVPLHFNLECYSKGAKEKILASSGSIKECNRTNE